MLEGVQIPADRQVVQEPDRNLFLWFRNLLLWLHFFQVLVPEKAQQQPGKQPW